MSKDLNSWEISLTNFLDINVALEEVEWDKVDAAFSIPVIDYSEIEMFDSVSLNFGVSLEVLSPNTARLSSVDELMSATRNWTDEADYQGNYSAAATDETDLLDSESISYSLDLNFDQENLLTALQEININTVDLLDPTRAYMEIRKVNDYNIPQLFSFDQVDLDSYDTTSIKVSDSDLSLAGSATDWSSIFADIERYVVDVFSQDVSDIIPDMQYKPIRSGMTLVKGKGRSRSRSLFSGLYGYPQNNFDSNEGRDRSLSIPMQLLIENGELTFKVNLNNVDLNYLEQIGNLPREMNMKSVLSLIPHQIKAK